MSDTTKFRAATMLLERDNGGSEKKWIIAADIGYSAVKIMSPTIAASFPSYAVRIDADRGTIGEVSAAQILYRDLETGETWLVGRDAQDRISDRDTSISEKALFGRERYEAPMFRVLCRVGLAIGLSAGKYGSPAGREVIVQTGFPPEYESDTQDMKDVIAGRHRFAVKMGNAAERKYDFEILPQNVCAMPQPMGTLFSVTIDENGAPVTEMQNCLKKNVIVFDGGFGTLDIFPIRAGRLEDCQTNDNLGMKRILKETTKELRRRHGIDVSVPALQKYLETGMARYHRKNVSKDIPFGDILEDASRHVCAEALSWVSQIYPLYEYDYLIITGGTGAAWAEIIKKELDGMSTLKIVKGNAYDTLPLVYANVRGYYLYRKAKAATAERK